MMGPLKRSILVLALASVFAPHLAALVGGGQKAEAALVRPDPAPVAAASGSLGISSKTKNGATTHVFQLKVKGSGSGAPYAVFMENAAGSATFTQVATLVGNSKQGKLKLDTHKGDTLPFGVDAVSDLAGRAIEIRSGATVVLEGLSPDFDAPTGGKVKDTLALPTSPPDAAVSGRLQLASKPLKGDEQFKLSAKKLSFAGKSYEAFMETTVGSGTFASIGAMDASSKGKLEFKTRKGQALPLGAQRMSDLAARAIEVRDDVGVVYLRGEMPSLEVIRLLVLDDETLDSGTSSVVQAAADHSVDPSFLVNDDSPTQIANPPLQWNQLFPGDIVLLPGGSVGDEGWFALPPAKDLPFSFAAFVAGTVPQSALDGVANVMPLRNRALMSLVGKRFVAVVQDSDVSMNYGPLQANLQGDRYGVFAFSVLDVVLPGTLPESGSSSSLYDVLVRVESPAAPVDSHDVPVRDAAPDSVSTDRADYDAGTDLLEIFGQSDSSPDAVLTVSIEGLVMDAPMLYNAVEDRYEYIVTTAVDLDGRAMTISSSDGGANNDVIQ